jgi:hypothetical protein
MIQVVEHFFFFDSKHLGKIPEAQRLPLKSLRDILPHRRHENILPLKHVCSLAPCTLTLDPMSFSLPDEVAVSVDLSHAMKRDGHPLPVPVLHLKGETILLFKDNLLKGNVLKFLLLVVFVGDFERARPKLAVPPDAV